jgi:hypothetical protein
MERLVCGPTETCEEKEGGGLRTERNVGSLVGERIGPRHLALGDIVLFFLLLHLLAHLQAVCKTGQLIIIIIIIIIIRNNNNKLVGRLPSSDGWTLDLLGLGGITITLIIIIIIIISNNNK